MTAAICVPSRPMELRSLSYFVRIAELGSITRAAAHLRLAQPALTRHVQRLEEELGVALFTRANRGVRLTEAGEKLLESAMRILRDVERSGDELRRTPLVLGDGLRAAMAALLAGRGIELRVETEVNDNETMRLMVQRGAAASVLPYSSVARECERGLLEAHRLTEAGVFRTLALGVRASRTASPAREAVVRTIAGVVAGMDAAGR